MQDASPAESFAIGQRMIARGGEYECEKYVHCVEPPHVIKCTNPPVMDQATRDALWGKKKKKEEKGKKANRKRKEEDVESFPRSYHALPTKPPNSPLHLRYHAVSLLSTGQQLK